MLAYLTIIIVVEAITVANMRSLIVQLWCRLFSTDTEGKVGTNTLVL